jgi:hypothetical protein
MSLILDGTNGVTFNNSTTQAVAALPLTGGTLTGNLVIGSGANGITFPATQSASSDANTLDDYEEGTFSPTVVGGTSGSATYGTQIGTYLKVGGWVFIQMYIDFSKSTISGKLNIANLPFTSKNAQYFSASCGYWSGFATAILTPTSFMGGNSTRFQLQKLTAASTNTNTSLTEADINASGNEIMFNVFYQVA